VELVAPAFDVADFPLPWGLCIVPSVKSVGATAGAPQAAAESWTPEAEEVLVARAKEGDRRALGLILTRFGPTLYRSVLLPRLGNPGVAEQALGDTYARVIEKIGSFEWQGVGIYPWLRVVALRVALDLLRARRREVLFEPEDLQREADAAVEDVGNPNLSEALIERRDLESSRAKLAGALDKINPRYAAAIRLRIIEERTRDEVAAELGVSTATFDVILHRAMTALRKVIAEGTSKGRS
jgi:RNA polymerase sigma-70 factor (ECF subfamily)